MPVNFLQKQEGPQAHVLRSREGTGWRAKVSKISGDFDEYQKQRRTAKCAAVLCGTRLAASEDFCGKADVARCKFSGRTAKTATRASRSLHAEAMGKRRTRRSAAYSAAAARIWLKLCNYGAEAPKVRQKLTDGPLGQMSDQGRGPPSEPGTIRF
jgi:hypothetical protein